MPARLHYEAKLTPQIVAAIMAALDAALILDGLKGQEREAFEKAREWAQARFELFRRTGIDVEKK